MKIMDMQDDKFLEHIVKNLVANPDDVKVTRTIDERGVLLTLDVNPADIGYVIGKKGQTITSLRTLVRIVGAKNNARVTVKVNEPEGGRRFERSENSAGSSSGAGSSMDDIDTSVVDNLEL